MLWDRRTGEPLHRAIVWQDRRTAGALRRAARARATSRCVRERTGLVLDPYFSGTKIEWLLDNVEGLRERAEPGAPCSARSTRGSSSSSPASHVTDPRTPRARCSSTSDAGAWDAELCDLLGVPGARCPRCAPIRRGLRRRPRRVLPVATACPSPASPATSRRRCSARPASTPGWARTPTGRARFVLLNTGASAARRQPGPAHDGGLGARRAADVRARGGDLRHRRRGAVAARRAGDHRAAPPRPRRWRRRSTSTTASTSSRRSPAWARRTGTRTRAGRSSASRAAPAARTSPARRSRRSPTRPSTRCARWRRRRASRSPSCAPTAARPRTLAHAVPGGRARRAGRACPEVAETTALGAAYLAGVGVGPAHARRRARALARGRPLRAARWPPTSATALLADWPAPSSAPSGRGVVSNGPRARG